MRIHRPGHRLIGLLAVILLPVIIGGLAVMIITSVFASPSASKQVSHLCTSASIEAMFGVQANELQQARSTSTTDTAIVMAQINASVGARLSECAGHLSATDLSELQTIQSEVSQ